MEVQIVAIGNPEKIIEIASEFIYVKKDNVFVISVPKNLQKYFISCLNSENILSYTYSQFKKLILPQKRSSSLSPVSSIHDWFRNGSEYFFLKYSDVFELNLIDKKTVKQIHKIDPLSICKISKDGSIYAFVKNNSIGFYGGDELELIFDMKYDENIESVEFIEDYENKDRKYCVKISLTDRSFYYDIMRGIEIEPIINSNGSMYPNINSNGSIEPIISSNRTNPVENVIVDNGRIARFVDGLNQKVIFDNGKITSKSMMHVKSIKFYFSKNRLFAFIIKNPGSGDIFIVESYLDGEITSTNIDSDILDISVSDDFFAVQLADFEVQFYVKEKYSFKKISSVKKNNPVKLSCFDTMCCVYDSQNIEFYDRAVLKCGYSGCSIMEWSPTGLYVAGFTYNSSGGSLLQIFNCNGALMFKKVYNGLVDFGWRGIPEIDEKEKKRILEEHKIDEIEENDEDEGKDKEELIEEWREYLTIKGII